MPIPMQMQMQAPPPGFQPGFPPGYGRPQPAMVTGSAPARWPGTQAPAPLAQVPATYPRPGEITAVRGVRPEEKRPLAMPSPETLRIAATQSRPSTIPSPEALNIPAAPAAYR
jgi:hypothetical protein